MIVKKVVNPLKSSPKAVRIQRLTEYIRAPETESSTEKCIYSGARGFLFDTPAAQTAEMLALSQDAVRSPDTITHYVLSWRKGEIPTDDQVEQAVDILLDEMKINEHQAVYGLHADTGNHHLHVAINRVHPKTLRVIKINQGWDIEAAHRVGVRVEHAQGWEPDANKRYRVGTDGKLERTDPDANSRPRKPSQQQLDAERRTGEPSLARMAIERAAPLIAAARTWEELHASLENQGIRYERAGGGAQIRVGTIPVKASRVARTATLKSLQARLGPYQLPPNPDANAHSRKPSQQQVDAECRTGEPSHARMAIEKAAPLIAAAQTWAELHASLENQGMRYELAGSGARIRVGTFPVKTSRVARTAMLKSLQARLGPYQPLLDAAPFQAQATARHHDAAPIIAKASSWAALHAALAERNLQFRRAGSGAHIVANGTAVTATSVSRAASLSALQKRLGTYQPPADPRPVPNPDANTCPRKPSQQQLDAGRWTGEPTHAHVAIERAALLIAAAENWADLHASLEKQGMRYELAGSGARIRVGTIPVKASHVARTATLNSLQARLGPYQPPPDAAPVQARATARHQDAAPIIAEAASWAALHAALAERSLQYRRAGSGAHIVAGGTAVKATLVSRAVSLSALQKRLGPYQPPADLRPALDPETRPGDALLDDYRRARDTQRDAQTADRFALQQRHDAERAALKERQAEERRDIFEGKPWRGHGALLNALRKEVATEQRAEMEDLRKKQRRKLEAHRRQYSAWPSYLDWLLENPEATRHLPGFQAGGHAAFSGPDPVPGYDHEVVRGQTFYRRRGAARSDIAFRDTGLCIYVHAPLEDEASVLAALQLAAKKWGTIEITGSPAFLRLSIRLAAQHGIDIANPELQEEIAREVACHREPPTRTAPEPVPPKPPTTARPSAAKQSTASTRSRTR